MVFSTKEHFKNMEYTSLQYGLLSLQRLHVQVITERHFQWKQHTWNSKVSICCENIHVFGSFKLKTPNYEVFVFLKWNILD